MLRPLPYEKMRLSLEGKENIGIIHLDAAIHLAKRLGMPTFFSFVF